MDTTAQQPINQVPVAQNSTPKPVVLQQPIQPAAPGMKQEHEIPIASAPIHELIKPTEHLPTVPPELAKEVKVVSEHPKLTLADQKAGVAYSPAATPVVIEKTAAEKLMDPARVEAILKTEKPGNSIKWLAALINKIFKRKA